MENLFDDELFEEALMDETDVVVANDLRKDIAKRLSELDKIRYKMDKQELQIRDTLLILYHILDRYLEFEFLDYKDAASEIYCIRSEKEYDYYGRITVNRYFNYVDDQYRGNALVAKYSKAREICVLLDIIRIILISTDLDREPTYKHLNMILVNLTPFLD